MCKKNYGFLFARVDLVCKELNTWSPRNGLMGELKFPDTHLPDTTVFPLIERRSFYFSMGYLGGRSIKAGRSIRAGRSIFQCKKNLQFLGVADCNPRLISPRQWNVIGGMVCLTA